MDAGDVEKYLSSPVYGEISESNLKVRRSLLLFSSVSVFASIAGIGMNPELDLLGIKFTNLTNTKIYFSFLLINLYFFVHYIWISSHSFIEWRLRLSGFEKAETLHNWWLSQMREVEKLNISSEIVLEHTMGALSLDNSNRDEIVVLRQSTINLGAEVD